MLFHVTSHLFCVKNVYFGVSGMNEKIIEVVEKEVAGLLASDSSGHDFLHTKRVLSTAIILCREEGANEYLVSLIALLHDCDDNKLFGDTGDSFPNARAIMKRSGVCDDEASRVVADISRISFSSGKVPESREGKIVQDADRLDALGAVGIARCFAFGGAKGRPMYTEDFMSEKATCSLSHFFQKLLHLEGLMNTASGKKEAIIRTGFIKAFLREFFRETDIS